MNKQLQSSLTCVSVLMFSLSPHVFAKSNSRIEESGKALDLKYKKALAAYDKGSFASVDKILGYPKTVDECILKGRNAIVINVGEGLPWFSRGVQLDGGTSKSLSYLAVGYIKLHRYEDALICMRDAIRKDPKNPELNSLLGRCLHKSGQAQAGFDLMNASLKRQQNSAICLQNLADSYAESFDVKEADKYYSRLVNIAPLSVEARLLRAYLYTQSGQNDKALADFGGVLKRNPDCQVAYYQRALHWQKLREYPKTIDDCKKAIACKDSIDQIVRKCMRTKIDAEEHLHHFSEAVKDSKLLTKDTANFVQSWGVRGDFLRQAYLLEREGKYDQALKSLEPLIKADPNRTEVMVTRARILGKCGKFSESLFLSNRLIARDPGIPGWYRIRARALAGLGDKTGAERDIDKAKALGKDFPILPGMYQDPE